MAPFLDFNILIIEEQKSAHEYLNRVQKKLEDAKRNAQNEELLSELKSMLQSLIKSGQSELMSELKNIFPCHSTSGQLEVAQDINKKKFKENFFA